MRIYCCTLNSFDENVVFVTAPPVNETETAHHLAITLVLNNGTQLDVNRMFEYRNNPVFTDIRPPNHLTV